MKTAGVSESAIDYRITHVAFGLRDAREVTESTIGGVTRFRNIEEANSARDRATIERMRSLRSQA